MADLADRLHVLNYESTLASGSPEDVLRNPDVVAAYLGRAAHAGRIHWRRLCTAERGFELWTTHAITRAYFHYRGQ